jgi:hypothetical protein
MTFWDEWQGKISRELLDTAVWLDSFFADERFLTEENRSYLRVRYDIFKEEGAAATYKPAFDMRLRLPELEKKLHIAFSAEPATPALSQPGPVTAAPERTEAGQASAVTGAFHYIFHASARESSIVRTGVQISHGTPVLFVAPRYRVLVPLDPWNVRFTQEATYRTDTKWQTDSRFDFERKLPREFFLRTTADGVWTEGVAGYVYSLGCSLRQVLNTSHALDYEWINIFQTRPVGELTEIDFQVRYRHSFLRNWLFYELDPQYRFPRDKDYHGVPGILFRLEVFFGVVQ